MRGALWTMTQRTIALSRAARSGAACLLRNVRRRCPHRAPRLKSQIRHRKRHLRPKRPNRNLRRPRLRFPAKPALHDPKSRTQPRKGGSPCESRVGSRTPKGNPWKTPCCVGFPSTSARPGSSAAIQCWWTEMPHGFPRGRCGMPCCAAGQLEAVLTAPTSLNSAAFRTQAGLWPLQHQVMRLRCGGLTITLEGKGGARLGRVGKRQWTFS